MNATLQQELAQAKGSSPREAWIVNALTDGGRGGNPAAVVLDADNLDVADRLAIASRIGLSETAFVSGSGKATLRLEFYTPTRQIAHCGHATIATFALLRSLGRIGDGHLSKETIDGLRTIMVDGEQVFMEQRAPKYDGLASTSAQVARIRASIGLDTAPVAIVDTGNRFAVIEVDGIESLRTMAPDLPAISNISDELDLVGYYVYSRTGAGPGHAATTRMFAPRYGIAEEAATGMAAGPLACLLHARHGLGETLTIAQGAFMPVPSPSVIEVRLDVRDREIVGLYAGGRARIERRLQL